MGPEASPPALSVHRDIHRFSPRSGGNTTVMCRAWLGGYGVGTMGQSWHPRMVHIRIEDHGLGHLAPSASSSITAVTALEDRAKPQRDRLMCTGHWRNRLQVREIGLCNYGSASPCLAAQPSIS